MVVIVPAGSQNNMLYALVKRRREMVEMAELFTVHTSREPLQTIKATNIEYPVFCFIATVMKSA